MARIEGFIDHFEKGIAFVAMLDRTMTEIPLHDLPLNVHQGDFIIKANDQHQFIINRKITELHHRAICRLNDYYFG